MDREEQLVVVRVEEGLYGLEIFKVKEVVKPRLITPIPHAPKFVEGLMNLRGQIVTVIYLADKLAALNAIEKSQTKHANKSTERIVVINQAGELVGLHVDAVDRVLTIDKGTIEQPGGNLKEQSVVYGVIQANETLILKLNTDVLLEPLAE